MWVRNLYIPDAAVINAPLIVVSFV
jgi:hypothetical protein